MAEKGVTVVKNTTLLLHEQILLLALRDEEGTIAPGTMYQYAIAGAILAELLLLNRIRLDSGKRKLVEVISPRPVGDPVSDECLKKIRDAKRRASLKTWVTRFASIRRLNHRIAERLCQRGILRADEGKVLLVFTRKIYPEVDPAPERELIEQLREAIFTENEGIEPRTVVLASLARSSNLLRIVFDKKELRRRKARLERIVNGEITGKAAQEAIEAMQAAVMAAAIIPAVVSSTVASH